MECYRRFLGSLRRACEQSGRTRALTALRSMDPRFLRESGLSPELIEQGVEAWPWRTVAVDQAPAPAPPAESRGPDSGVDGTANGNLAERKHERGGESGTRAAALDDDTDIAA